ncbi:MAG: tryptophan--tRNA ligase [Bacteroidota bacterium]
MARILTGIQSTGVPHLGNMLGAILPAIELANDPANDSFLFMADMHTLTSIKDASVIRENTYATAAAWLACGLDTDQSVFYRQSDIPEVTELTWYLNCFMPYSRLQLAHSFKDKADRMKLVSAGLFTYPVLMAADILLYDTDIVPVGKDQKQHLEYTRNLAQAINREYKKDILIVPEVQIDERVMVIPGTDGNKMSKSRDNTLVIFMPDKKLRKKVMKIVTDTKSVEEPKDPDSCNVFRLYELLANEEQITEMRKNYLGGNYGYGTAKQALFELIIEQFKEERERYNYYMENLEEVDKKLAEGADKARAVALEVLQRVRETLGYKKEVKNLYL